MQPVIVTISEEGVIRFLSSDATSGFLADEAVTRRASHVEPVRPSLRYVFHGLRSIFGEYGWMAGFTRQWPCEWRINLAPISGPILPQTYMNRQAAIDAEIGYLNANFI